MLRQTLPYRLDRKETELYDRAVATYPQSGGVAAVSKLIYDGTYGMYIVDSPNATTMVIVRMITHPNGTSDLFILMLSGDGSFTDFEYCLNELKGLASENGCSRVSGMINAESWEKFKDLGNFATSGYVEVSFDVDQKESFKGQVESNG